MKKNHAASVPILLALSMSVMGFVPSVSQAKKKHFSESGKLVEMQAVPCGSRQKGLAGVGNVFASVGITDVNAKDKLCQEYVLRTADEEYRIRPVDDKHPVLLPIGAESEFQIKKDRVLLSVPEGDGKVREYKVVAMKPLEGASNEAPASYSAAPSGDSRPAVGGWTAALDRNSSGSSANPAGSSAGDSEATDASSTASDRGAADYASSQVPDAKEYQGTSDSPTDYHLAMTLEQKGDLNGAVAEFRKVIEAKPDDARAHAALAGALERRGDSAGALREYGLALKLDPDDAAVRANYDRLVQTAGGGATGSGS